MSVQTWTYIIVGLSFALYIGIAIWSKVASTREFYVAGRGVHPVTNGLATAADWMSAASFISMAGLIAFDGRDGSRYLMGWTGGYVLLALLLAPYLRKFGKFTVPDFVGDRYYSTTARLVAVVCVLFVSFTYIAGQMRGVGIVFSRFLNVSIDNGVIVGMIIVFSYAVLGGMKGITYTQVAQYCVLIFAFMVPAVFISLLLTGHPVPQTGFGGRLLGSGEYLLDRLDGLTTELGFGEYTAGRKSTIDVLCITAALMVGTAGLPHVIIRFFTVPSARDARVSAGWTLLFIAILYTTAPAVAAFARVNLIESVSNTAYTETPDWFRRWETTGLVAWMDKDADGRIAYVAGDPFAGKPVFTGETGRNGERLLSNTASPGRNELYIDPDIMVLANPEIAHLPAWVIALVAAGGLAAALSTAAGLLLVISTAISHDLLKKALLPEITDERELLFARVAAGAAVLAAAWFGIHPPGFVAQVVAFAFGLAAATFFPVLVLGVFSKRVNREGAIAGMVMGLVFTFGYIVKFKFVSPELNTPAHWWLGISPEGIGTVGMLINTAVMIAVSALTPPPPDDVQKMIEEIRLPGER
ncbi:MAG: cation acetate symporter [Deltaproteobacteria bacterium]|nr:cation acetate symporter [Deltaproteobacteria bacterium]